MAKRSKKNENSYEENTIYIDLRNQLIANANYTAYTEDLLQKYMRFTDIEDKLNEDIEERGVSVYWSNGGGQEGFKKNDSISELTKVNAQKAKLLNTLGIKAPESKDEGGKEYEV